MVAGECTRGIIRTTPKTTILTVFHLQPASAFRAGLDGLSAISATEYFAFLDEQPLPANRTRPLRMIAIGVVRTTIEITAVPFAYAVHKMSLDAYWTVNVVFRRTTEDGDVVSILKQFRYEGRNRTTLGK